MIKLVAVVGPTASGKSALAMELAEKFGGEIISADSMQIYKGMDIGTAKPSKEDQSKIRHHMIDCVEVTDNYSVANYCDAAHRAIAKCVERGKVPIVAGGTGLYVENLLKNTDFSAVSGSGELRAELIKSAAEHGGEAMYEYLMRLDMDAAKLLHPNDTKRVIRALECYLVSGKTRRVRDEESKGRQIYKSLKLTLDIEREVLYNRINARVEEMFDRGLVEEVKSVLLPVRDRCTTSLAGIGYKEVLDYIDGRMSLEDTKEKIKLGTRRYAKRQETWFRHDRDIKRVQNAQAFEIAETFIYKGEVK
ncbi:MAG: tRNA (adenosine(37)-N6)-dimethylallyltransferase MiaA [Clostridia bacterium]|nr:tRNA (adenosine(37)-N6)-dimethylallyltransferase MiaA [Clostridia bacterium]